MPVGFGPRRAIDQPLGSTPPVRGAVAGGATTKPAGGQWVGGGGKEASRGGAGGALRYDAEGKLIGIGANPTPGPRGRPLGMPGQRVGTSTAGTAGAAGGGGSFSDMLNSIMGAAGGVGGAASLGGAGVPTTLAPGGPGPQIPDYVLQAQNDPFLTRQAERIEGRLDEPDKLTERLIEQGVGAIRDLGEGQREAARGAFSRLGAGVGESGAELEAQNQITQGVQSAGARAASDIATGRARDYDQLLLGATGSLGAVGEASRAERGLGLGAWTQLEAARRAREEVEIQRQRAVLEAAGQKIGLIQSMLGLIPSLAGPGAYGY